MAILNPKALFEARQKKGWTQLQLSEATKPRINISTISRIERRKSARVRESTLMQLGNALGVSRESLCQTAEAEREVVKLRIESAARNALTLVALRYRVSRERIIEAAPLLFLIAAEQSLQKRRKCLAELEGAAEAVYGVYPSHLPLTASVDDMALDCERRSIEERDLFATKVADEVGVPDRHRGEWDEGEDNPFASFLSAALTGVAGSTEPVQWTPGLWPSYRICAEEAAKIVGGDAKAAQAILNGAAALHEMPKGSTTERAEWARAEFDRKYGDIDGMFDDLIEQSTSKNDNSGSASDDGAA